MSKPIFILEVPEHLDDDTTQKVTYKLEKKLEVDYHVLVIRNRSVNFVYQCYNAENMTEIEFDELKKLVEETIKQPVT